jgi:hypothetical protein
MHDDWFNFEPAPLTWYHEYKQDAAPEDLYAKGLFQMLTLEQVNEKLKDHGWRWN